MVFFPTTIFDFASTAARTSSSQTKPTGFVSFFSTFGLAGSSCAYDERGGATADVAVGAGAATGGKVARRDEEPERPPSH